MTAVPSRVSADLAGCLLSPAPTPGRVGQCGSAASRDSVPVDMGGGSQLRIPFWTGSWALDPWPPPCPVWGMLPPFSERLSAVLMGHLWEGPGRVFLGQLHSHSAFPYERLAEGFPDGTRLPLAG